MPKQVYGWVRQEHDPRDYRMQFSARRLATLPTSVNLAPTMSQPDKQGNLGSCGPNTSDECLKFDFKAESLPVRNTSRLFTYYNTRYLMGTVAQDSGVDNRTMLKALAKYGFCDESIWPYDISTFAAEPPAAAYAAALPNAIASYAAVPTDLQSMKACLASGHPFIFGFSVFQEMESDAVAASGLVPMPSFGETPIGGHDVTCFGYDDGEQVFFCTNHWDQWGIVIGGLVGCFKIPYQYASNPNLASDFWVINAVPGAIVVPPDNPPSPPSPPSPAPSAGAAITLSAPMQPGQYEVMPAGSGSIISEMTAIAKKFQKLITG